MRGQTKIAVAVGAVLIVAGLWYVGKGDKAPSPVAQNTPDVQAPKGSDEPPVTLAEGEHSADGSQAQSSGNHSGVASPIPPRIEDSPVVSLTKGEHSRPLPAETDAPFSPMTSTDLPKERAGLSTVMSNAPALPIEHSPVAGSEDMPPNADKDAHSGAPVLPTIEPVGIVSGGAATQPSGTAAKTGTASTPPLKAGGQPVEKLSDGVAEKPKSKEYVVKSGDSFSTIASKQMGSVKYVKELMKANPGKDPRKLYVGAKLVIPEVSSAVQPEAAKSGTAAGQVGGPAGSGSTTPPVKAPVRGSAKETYVVPPPDPSRSYTVQPGEGWYDLARKFMGDGKDYPKLYEHNKERVGGDPQLLRAGTVIELPEGATLPADTAGPKPTAPPAK